MVEESKSYKNALLTPAKVVAAYDGDDEETPLSPPGNQFVEKGDFSDSDMKGSRRKSFRSARKAAASLTGMHEVFSPKSKSPTPMVAPAAAATPTETPAPAAEVAAPTPTDDVSLIAAEDKVWSSTKARDSESTFCFCFKFP